MRRLTALIGLCAVLLAALAPVAAIAQVPTMREAITVSSAAVSIAESTYKQGGIFAYECFLTLADNQIRWSTDGVAPTASVGHVFDVGARLKLMRAVDMQRFKAIRVSADGVLTVSCQFR